MPRAAMVVLSLLLSASAGAGTLRVLALQSDRFFYERNGQLAGIEYEILDYFARSRGDELDVKWAASFPELLSTIEKGEGDIAAGTITVTEERDRRMDFSAGYFPVQVVLVERKGETSSSLEELAGFQAAAFRETTAEDALESVAGIELVVRSGIDGMLSSVASGEIQAAAADSSAVIPVLDDYPTLEISLTFGEEQHFGFALPEGSALKEPLSRHIRSLKGSGIYFRIVTEHMGPRASEIVRAAREH